MAVKVEIQLQHSGAQQLIQRMTAVRKEVSTLAIATKAVGELPLGTQQQLARMDRAIAKTNALTNRASALKKELQATGTARLIQLAEQEAKEALVDVNALNASVKELRDSLETPVKNNVAGAVQAIAAPRRPAITGAAPASLNDRTINQALGGLAALNVPGASQLRIVADIADVTENLPKLADEIKALGLAGGIATAAIGAYAAGFYFLNKSIQAGAKAVEEAGKAERERLEALKRTREELRTLSFDEVTQKISDLETDLANTTESRNRREQELAKQLGVTTEGALKDFLEASANLTSGIDLTNPAAALEDYANSLKQLADTTGLSEGEIQKARDEIQGYNDDIKAQTDELNRLRNEILAFTQGRDAATGFINELNAAGQRAIRTSHDIRNLSSNDVQQQIADARQRLEIARANREAISAEVTRLQSEWATATGDEAKRLEGEITGLIEASKTYDQQIANEITEVERLTSAVIPLVEQREKEARTLSQIKDAQTQRNELLEKEKTALNALKSAQQALADFEAQVANEARTKAQEKAIQDRQSAELDAIDTQIQAAQAAEKQAQAQQKLSDLELDRNAKLNEVLTKGRDEEQRRQDQFGKELERFARDTALQARRIFRDTGKAIDEAVASNDVVAFANAIEERNKSLSDLQEDADIEAADRIRDFNDESIRLTQDREQQLQQIRTQFEQQRLQLVQQSGSQELTLVEQLQRQRALIVARHQQELENFRIRQEVDAINRRRQLLIADINSRQQEYDALRRQGQQNAFNIARSMVLGFFSGLSPQQQQAQQAVSNFGSQAIQQFKNVLPKFGHGGLVKKPTVGLLGERPGWMDLVIPVKKSDGAQSAIAGRGGVTIHINNPSITSESELNRIANHIGNKVVAAIGVA